MGEETLQDSVDTEQLEGEEVVEEDSTSKNYLLVQNEGAEDVDQTTDPAEEEAPTTVAIGGEEYTLDELAEFRQGYLRQSDYTKKTQEIAELRKENEKALEMYEYLKSNPHITEQLSQIDVDPNIRDEAINLTPEMQRINELEKSMAQRDLDMNLKALSEKYPDFDEVKVLQEAHDRGIGDLEFVYKALREDEKVDVEKIKQEAVSQAKKEIMAEINKNKDTTKTLIDNESKTVKDTAVTLTPAQKSVARGMGLSEKEYGEWLRK